MYISRLEMYIFRLEIYIFRLEMEFLGCIDGFLSVFPGFSSASCPFFIGTQAGGLQAFLLKIPQVFGRFKLIALLRFRFNEMVVWDFCLF